MKLYPVKVGKRKLYTPDKVFADFMNGKKKKPGFWKRVLEFLKRLLP